MLAACAHTAPPLKKSEPPSVARNTSQPAAASTPLGPDTNNTRPTHPPEFVTGTGAFTRAPDGAAASPPGASSAAAGGLSPNPDAAPGGAPSPGAFLAPGTPGAPGAPGAGTQGVPNGIPAPAPRASPAGGTAPASAQEGFQLSFVDTDIGTVVASVLGDGLGLSYTVDPKIKGTMTLQSPRPLSHDELLSALETGLRLNGIVMVEVNGAYNVIPSSDAKNRGLAVRTPCASKPGFAIQVVPLQYVGASDMDKVLRSVAPEGAVVRVDEGRNLLMLAGTGQELATMLDTVRMFDVNWLRGMSFALFTLEYVYAKTAADELSQVFSDTKSPIASVVRFIPITRLNAVMVVSHQAEYLKEVEGWIKRLDIGLPAAGRRIYVYDVQNGKADELAKALAHILSLSTDDSSQYSSSQSPFGGSSMFGSSGSSGSSSFGSSGSSGLGGSSSGLGSSGLNGGFDRSNNSGQSGPFNGAGNSSYDRGSSGNGSFESAQRSGGGRGIGGGGVNIEPHEESNSLMILATPAEFAIIEAALKHLDVPPLQVMIEASLAEVTLTDTLRFGLQWAYQGQHGPILFSESSSGSISQQFPGFSYLYTGSQDIQAVLNSLESITKVKVLSAPKLLVLNNREAELSIGDQVPVVTQSAVGTVSANAPIVNSVELRDTGVILRVVPRVNKNGLVMMDIAQEVSDVVPTTSSSINSPTIQQRKLASSVAVRDGETIALGGLIRDDQTRSRDGLPLLSRIPVLGALFGSNSTDRRRTELIVLLTPHVMRSEEDRAAMMDDMRSQFESLRKAISVWPEKTATAPSNNATQNAAPSGKSP